MTTKLEELFNMDDDNKEDNSFPQAITDKLESLGELANMENQLTKISDLTGSDKEMDDLAEKAVTGYHDLMDLGMNVEPKYSAPLFEAASKLLGHAIQAKTNKIDKKLKTLDIQIKQRRVAVQEKLAGLNEIEVPEQHLDRNELIKALRSAATSPDTK